MCFWFKSRQRCMCVRCLLCNFGSPRWKYQAGVNKIIGRGSDKESVENGNRAEITRVEGEETNADNKIDKIAGVDQPAI